MSDQKAIPRRVRYEVLRRDGFTCRYCGATAPDVRLTVDHVVPRVLGGADAPENLVAACGDCNAGKASTGPDEHVVAQVSDDALRWAEAMREAAAERRSRRDALNADLETFQRSWNAWSSRGEPIVPLPDGWRTSVEHFIAAGLRVLDLVELIDVAMGSKASHRNVWRYFCGCAWNTVNGLQARAGELARAAQPTEPADPSGLPPVPEGGTYWTGEQVGHERGFVDGFRAGYKLGQRQPDGPEPQTLHEMLDSIGAPF